MAIDRASSGNPGPVPPVSGAGWLEVNGTWLAGMWGTQFNGCVRIVDAEGKVHIVTESAQGIQIGIAHPSVENGKVYFGNVGHAVIPAGLIEKTK